MGRILGGPWPLSASAHKENYRVAMGVRCAPMACVIQRSAPSSNAGGVAQHMRKELSNKKVIRTDDCEFLRNVSSFHTSSLLDLT